MQRALAIAIGLSCVAGDAIADDGLETTASATVSPAATESSQSSLGEANVFAGGFVSNYFHQFYDAEKFPMLGARPELHRVSPEFGFRYAYFFSKYLGAEGELSIITASTVGMNASGIGPDQSAKIYNLRLEAILQYPMPQHVTPFVTAGFGPMHTSSDYLGSDTDNPLHVGAGVRYFITDAIAARADFRYLRGPSEQAPYTLNAGYAEFSFGVSFSPRVTPSKPEPPKFDGDRDGDGIPDSKDKCPDQPEDKDMFQDADGCPDPDNDGDGIPDTIDKCPLDPEDKDGFQDADGCPDLDNDGDGIPDKMDKCPNDPEDKDGFQDLDGCPDLDNDNDGIPDAKDKCPNEPETINGFQDEDGCPDRGDSLVVLSPDRLELLESIQFRGDKLTKADNNILGQIAATLRAHTEIVRLRVTAYVQPTADYEKDQAQSDARAAAVRDWLVKWGIAAKRLEPRGFGGTKPLVPAAQKGAAAINDRVELIILERK